MFLNSSYYYYIIIGLQAICVIHCLRKGKNQQWIWLIVFLPLIGCLVYIFQEMFSGNEIKQVQSGVSTIINPTGSIRKLETQLKLVNNEVDPRKIKMIHQFATLAKQKKIARYRIARTLKLKPASRLRRIVFWTLLGIL